jgi:hypothetical protein
MRCKIVRTQKLMWRNIMRSTKSKKVSVLYYSIDIYIKNNYNCKFILKKCYNVSFIYIIQILNISWGSCNILKVIKIVNLLYYILLEKFQKKVLLHKF